MVFRPARTLEGDEFRVSIGLHLQALVDRMGRVVLLELMIRIEFYGHAPDVVVDTALTSTDGVVVALHIVEVDAS